VVVAVQTATHVTIRDTKTIRKLIATRLDTSKLTSVRADSASDITPTATLLRR
jgi:hypothetical protein